MISVASISWKKRAYIEAIACSFSRGKDSIGGSSSSSLLKMSSGKGSGLAIVGIVDLTSGEGDFIRPGLVLEGTVSKVLS